MSILIVHPRKGLYQLTSCQECGHHFECQQCSAKLVTYRESDTLIQLCHQCQTSYPYPKSCPDCKSCNIKSIFGGIQDLEEIITKNYTNFDTVIRLDQEKDFSIFDFNQPRTVFLTTRVYDPLIPYNELEKVIFIQAENLLASLDYTVQEELLKNLMEVMIRAGQNTDIMFDTIDPSDSFFESLTEISRHHPNPKDINQWFINGLNKETELRKKFNFAPYKNLLLLTTQEPDSQKSLSKIRATAQYFQKIQEEFPGVNFTDPYEAKVFKRKGMFAHHFLIKYPLKYQKFQELQQIVQSLASLYNLQVRLNPRHLF